MFILPSKINHPSPSLLSDEDEVLLITDLLSSFNSSKNSIFNLQETTNSNSFDLIHYTSLFAPFAHYSQPPQILSNHSPEIELPNLFNTSISNPSTSQISLKVTGTNVTYAIPPKSSFYLSDLKNIDGLCSFGTFDLIIMDPPWINKSVQRSGKYPEIDCYDLYKIPIKKLAKNNLVVGIWVTNNPKFIKFVRNKLFPNWNLECIAEWFWIKVKKNDNEDPSKNNQNNNNKPFEFVTNVKSKHRRPYERLLIGKTLNSVIKFDLPVHLGIVATVGFHSQKPMLGEIFENFHNLNGHDGAMAAKNECLELFARRVSSGWTCWGNEVLKFNEMEVEEEKK